MDNISFAKFLPSPPDSRDYGPPKQAVEVYHAHVDLLPDVEEVENQLQSNSCTANAAASALELAYKRAGSKKDFSRLYNYWWSRVLGGLTGDGGAYPRDVCKALNKYGICLETTWEFDLVNNLNTEPSAIAQEEAKQYPILEYSRLDGPNIIEQIKASVASGIPVMASIKVTKDFYNLGQNWKTHEWDPAINSLGNHQILIIGYNDAAGRFLALNSWGNYWGDGGFFGIPYTRVGVDYYASDKSAYEYWILNKIGVPYRPADGSETDPDNQTEQADNRAKLTRNILSAIGILGAIAIWFITK